MSVAELVVWNEWEDRAACLGVDSDLFFPQRGQNGDMAKAKQVCRQVAETLDQVLSGETADDILRNLRVATVVPAPDSSRLFVTLHADLSPAAFDRNVVEQKLASHTGRLRCEVARAITRRKTPALAFHVIGPDSSPASQGQEGNR